jgi:hypothetical protein
MASDGIRWQKEITPVPLGPEVTGGERDDELSGRSSAAADPRMISRALLRPRYS